MKKSGRPSKNAEDREKLVEMAERWCAGAAGLSISKIARIVVGLEAASVTSTPRYSLKDYVEKTPKPSSAAKRLERRFKELVDSGAARKISAYKLLNQERTSAMNALGKKSYGRFHIEDRDNDTFVEINKIALARTATRCGIAESDIDGMANEGLNILREWFPREYPPSKI
jgi:hypothetical protein